jgi:predicted dienelactone hydrolase
MGINLLVPALLVFYSAAAQAPPIWNGLQPGRYGAGVSVSTAGSLPITVWYPSSAAGKPVTLAGFVTSAASFADEAGVDGLPAEIITRYASQPLFATADAPAAAGRFPLVVVAQGNQQRPLHQAVLAEYLASHGFVVVTAISTTVTAPMKTAEDVGPAAQREAEQLEKLAAFGRTLP